MSEIKNVVLAGAGGSLGPDIIREFTSSGKFNLFVLSRPASKSNFPASVKVLRTDYTPASLKSIFSGNHFDAVISLLTSSGPTLGDAQTALIDASVAAGVKRFFPSEFGSDTANVKLMEKSSNPMYADKRGTVEYLKKVQNDSESFTWSAVVTGPWLDWGLENAYLPVDIKAKKFFKWDDGDAAYSTTTLPTIAKTLLSILSSPSNLLSTTNEYVYIQSFAISSNQLFDAVRKATGEEWEVVPVDSEEVRTKAKAKEGFYMGSDLIKAAVFGKDGLGDHSKEAVRFEALGLPKEDLEVEVKKVLEGRKY